MTFGKWKFFFDLGSPYPPDLIPHDTTCLWKKSPLPLDLIAPPTGKMAMTKNDTFFLITPFYLYPLYLL